MIARSSVGRSSGSTRVARRSGSVRSRSEIAAALADVVGVEPSPAHPRAAFRLPVPGLAPLAALRRAVEQYAARLKAQSHTVAGAAAEIERAVRHALPGGTPDWSTHLLLQELERWTAAAYDAAGGAGGDSRDSQNGTSGGGGRAA